MYVHINNSMTDLAFLMEIVEIERIMNAIKMTGTETTKNKNKSGTAHDSCEERADACFKKAPALFSRGHQADG